MKPLRYQVTETRDLLAPENPLLLERGFHASPDGRRRCLVVIDRNVERLFGDRVQTYFDANDVVVQILTIAADEGGKSMENVFEISRTLHEFGLSRRSEPLVAIGGGVLMDMAGLAASIYRRGVPYLRIPTTLMGLIDAGVGIKTGVNFDLHKNRLGSYYAPIAAYLDRSFLDTLAPRHLSNGLAEILKIALIKDYRLFELMERHADTLITERLQGGSEHDEIFWRAIQGMLEELEPNLWEDHLERLVDYGHSFSPAIEMAALPQLLHGEAVNIDMAFTLVLAMRRGLVSEQDLGRALEVMRRLQLPIHHPLCTAELLNDALADTVKHRDGQQRLPLTAGLGGAVFVNDVSADEIAAAEEALSTRARSLAAA